MEKCIRLFAIVCVNCRVDVDVVVVRLHAIHIISENATNRFTGRSHSLSSYDRRSTSFSRSMEKK